MSNANLAIRNAQVVDGTGAPSFKGDVAVADGKILAVGKFEDMLISAMHMCGRLKLRKALGRDKDRWQQSSAKAALLRASTLESLIKIRGCQWSVGGRYRLPEMSGRSLNGPVSLNSTGWKMAVYWPQHGHL